MHNQIVEGLFFLKGEEGVSIELIETVFEVENDKACEIINDFIEYWETQREDSALQIDFINQKWKFVTKPDLYEYYRKMFINEPKKLSNSALEVLAIVAYNQPCKKSKVEYIRGVNSESVIRRLEALGFIEVVGIDESAGNATLFGTTELFLDYFGVTSLEEMPPIDDFNITDLDEEEVDLFLAKYTEKEEKENEVK